MLIIFNPMDARGDVGCEEGSRRLYHRIMNYLSMSGERTKIYRFFDFKDNLAIEFLSQEVVKNHRSREELIKRKLTEFIESSRPFFYIGGNHLSVLPILKFYDELDSRTLFLAFDSHLDAAPSSLLGKEWDPDKELNFGNYLSPFLKRKSSLSFVHVGSKHPLRQGVLRGLNMTVLTAQDLLLDNEDRIEARLDQLISYQRFDRLHIDIDLDVLDHSIMRATFDPGSFGLTLSQLLRLIRCAISKLPLAGIDIIGYNPRIEPSQDYEEVCLRLFENIIYEISKSKTNNKFWFGEKIETTRKTGKRTHQGQS